jgi:hypothetical protein
LACLSGLGAICVFAAPPSAAFEIETNVADLKASWETTLKYAATYRVRNPSAALVARSPSTINQDDGDRDFRAGLVSNRLDLFTEADVTYRSVGARVSAAAWYDDVYFRQNDHDSPATANAYSVRFNEFTHATRQVHGSRVELLDGFVFGRAAIGDMQASFRAGQHALLWGESLFFGSNGIAGAQAPVDVVKLLSVPNSQFKEVIRPIGQLSGQLQITPAFSISAYYQYTWRKSRLPAVGSYFSTTDLLDSGGERILAGPPIVPQGGPAAFFRGVDESARNSGQAGLALRMRVRDVDFGLYAVQWHSKTPQVYLRPSAVNPSTGQIGIYSLVYPEDIRSYGASASTSIGDVNVAGEFSVRRDTPLVSNAQVVAPSTQADNSDHPLYAVGHTMHAQISVLWTVAPNFLARSSTLLAEIAWNRRTSVIRNPAALDPNAGRDAASVRALYEPIYRQVYPGLDVSVPIGGSCTLGKSSAVGAFGVNRGGDLNVGVSGAYLDRYRFTLSYTHYYGPQGAALDASNHFTFAQSLADRDFVSLSLRTTF